MGLKSKSFLYQKILPNQKFEDWTTTDEWKKRGSSWYVKCRCRCNLEYFVLAYDLLRKKSLRCQSCSVTKKNIIHGHNCHGSITYEYRLWQNKKHLNDLDSSWKDNFQIFIKDIGLRPDKLFKLLKKNTNFKHSQSNSFWGHPRLRFFKNIKGKKFGEWTVLEEDFLSKNVGWICQCSCGRKDRIEQRYLINGKSKKCKSCAAPKHLLKHGQSAQKCKTTEYTAYYNMKVRCYNKNSSCYKHYGYRGIKVCDRWLESFENFFKDMGKKPTPKHSLDRIDNNGDYCKDNCKWSTQKEQVANRRKISDLQEIIDKNKLV